MLFLSSFDITKKHIGLNAGLFRESYTARSQCIALTINLIQFGVNLLATSELNAIGSISVSTSNCVGQAVALTEFR